MTTLKVGRSNPFGYAPDAMHMPFKNKNDTVNTLDSSTLVQDNRLRLSKVIGSMQMVFEQNSILTSNKSVEFGPFSAFEYMFYPNE